MLTDRLGRPLRDLRISVTDRCNFRCTYCMPRETFGADFAFLPRRELLDFEEVTRLARLFVALGVRKLRLTGGEPLLRRELDRLVASLAALDGVEDIALTTNGSLLAAKAEALHAAGLERVTVSLDALDEPTFTAMADTRVPLQAVLDGIDTAQRVGLGVKINTVVRRGVNEHAVEDLVAYGRRTGATVRFIEYMDVGGAAGWRLEDVVAGREIAARIEALHPIAPVDASHHGEVAQRFRYLDGGGEVGVITSVTRPFCRTCTRARISAVGVLYTCLFAADGTDLRAPLRGGATDAELRRLIAGRWEVRTDRYSELRTAETAALPKVEMHHIGG